MRFKFSNSFFQNNNSDNQPEFNGDYNNYPNYNNPFPNNDPKAKTKRQIRSLTFAIIGCFLAGAILAGSVVGITVFSNQTNSVSYNKTTKLNYNTTSDASYWISQRTFSLLFNFKSSTTPQNDASIVAGTGWIYSADKNTNTFYVATNLHVANILSFVNNDVTSYDEDNNQYESVHYDSITSYLGLALGLTKDSNAYNNQITYIKVNNPSVVYTTTNDASFNNTFNSTDNGTTYTQQYYGKSDSYSASFSNNSPSSTSTSPFSGTSLSYPTFSDTTPFYGASDIAILKYTIDPNNLSFFELTNNNSLIVNSQHYLNKFSEWITNYFNNPTVVYKEDVENLQLNANSRFYMGGYPSYDISTNNANPSNGTDSISWLSFSDFDWQIYPRMGQSYFYSSADWYQPNSTWSDNETPIAFYGTSTMDATASTDYTHYNYMSVGLLSLLGADSFSGASGSPIVIQTGDGSFEIVGIYWGSISFSSQSNSSYGQYSNNSLTYGTMNWFATNNYSLNDKKISYNLTTAIDSIIGGSN
ncbi:MAG: hypothetical protein HUJ42_01780 [Malacoplasma sp.]|nr:hypothetical protein [Malacoplasma sp.]